MCWWLRPASRTRRAADGILRLHARAAISTAGPAIGRSCAPHQAPTLAYGARDGDPFICSVQAHRRGLPLQRHALRRRFLTACKALGRKRLRMLTIHHGRHTFISHALAGGRTLAEVRDAAGHSSVLVTSAYLHVAVEDDGAVGSLFRVR